MPVYSRADLPRTARLVVVPFFDGDLGAFAREFRAGAIDLDCTNVVAGSDRNPFEAAMAPIHENAQRYPASAMLIERICKVE